MTSWEAPSSLYWRLSSSPSARPSSVDPVSERLKNKSQRHTLLIHLFSPPNGKHPLVEEHLRKPVRPSARVTKYITGRHFDILFIFQLELLLNLLSYQIRKSCPSSHPRTRMSSSQVSQEDFPCQMTWMNLHKISTTGSTWSLKTSHDILPVSPKTF